MIKIQDAGNGYRIRLSCDKNGIEQSRTASFSKNSKPNTAGYFLWIESEEWLKDNEILPQFTASEISSNNIKKLDDALKLQNKTLINLISDNEYHLISRRFAGDRGTWEVALDAWSDQLESNVLTEIYKKPFS